ncbi:hypothetical protein SAMN06298226_1058 [Nitrosovibrio sp. Nv4]|nr:hypothetical protein SAMN06298226_1058 [Nitrosovibrio sp. Nv4]
MRSMKSLVTVGAYQKKKRLTVTILPGVQDSDSVSTKTVQS